MSILRKDITTINNIKVAESPFRWVCQAILIKKTQITSKTLKSEHNQNKTIIFLLYLFQIKTMIN